MARGPVALTPRERLIFALDAPSGADALAWVDRLGDAVQFYKIGMELLASGVIRGLSRWPVTYATIHGWHAGMMEAAAAAREGDLRLLAVTVLTSMDGNDLRAMGINSGGPADIVVQRALAAQASGIDGVICSGQEAGMIRAATGPGFSIVCPGIRPGGPVGDDQKRTVGVAEAFALGADAIVVGRPISKATDPKAAAEAIQAEIAAAIK